MFFRIYKSSFLATVVSIIGAGFLYGGIVCVISGLILPGILCAAAGIAIHLAAESMAEKAVFNKWKKSVVEKGYAQRIAAGDYSVAVQLYNQNPKERTVEYFASLNADVGARLRAAIQASSAQK